MRRTTISDERVRGDEEEEESFRRLVLHLLLVDQLN